MEIVIIILVSITLLGLLAFFIYEVKAHRNVKEPELNLKEIWEIQHKLNELNNEIKNDIELSVAKQMKEIAEHDNKTNELNNEKLERFQKNISESINKRFDSLNEQMTLKMSEINKKVDQQLEQGFKTTTESMSQVRERLKVIDEAQKNIESLSKDVVSLKNVLENNQNRGQYGEYQLSMVLHNVFGDTIGCYKEQYTIKNAKDEENKVRADAVVFMPEPNKMICIDSKFPFATYARLFETTDEKEKEDLQKLFVSDVKKHITTIKNKYIIDGKTAPQAIMFIPNDGIFAYIHQNCESVVEYARQCEVILTSPSTLPAILVTINMIRIEGERAKNVREITNQLVKLGKEFGMFSKEWETFSTQLGRASSSKDKLDNRVNKINNKFEALKISDTKYDEIEEKATFVEDFDEIDGD
ncbi:MAG: DNA recombination protein RmuC [Erysipelotrichaceae bacterium]|nr:DNA recombination protein RmuC [Erysipelotrichaceae bacterium]